MQLNTGKRLTTVVILLLAFGGALGSFGFATLRIGQAWGASAILSELTFGTYNGSNFAKLPRYGRLMFSLRESFWFNKSRYYSTDGQDRWIADIVFPDVKNGFYVDVGSGDGVRQSNTKALDDRGWKGICIDPFPTGMDTRTARLFKDVVSSEKGHKVKFRKSGFMGGIEDDLNHTKDWVVVKNAETFELITTTLDEILSRADAPMHIQYMSIDVEGAELRALQGLSFSKYKVDAFTIEHNWEEPKRSQIRELLESKGYRNVFGRGRDDYYILSGLRGEGW